MRLLRSPNTLSLIGAGLLAILVLLFGELIALDTREARLLTAASLIAIWLTVTVLRLATRVRSGISFERLLRAQLDNAVIAATPEQRGETALLRKQLLAAITTIKTSNIGRTRGKAALYELPWYMVIGHPAAGKSSLIQHSGLSFPITENGNGAVRGVGGTRNCDWFFSTEGVLLDTAGRYATQKEDRVEWLELLRLLKKHRPRTPVNGILVTISLPELIQFRSEGFSEYARQIRARIAEIDQAFERKVPVYLLITKLDLLGGFRQFFEYLGADDRQQVWGATFTVDGCSGGNRALVAEQFDLLVNSLVATGTTRLGTLACGAGKPALFAFPIEFRTLKAAIDRFVELLLEEDPYHTEPLLRGFYLTSALQDGVPRIPAGERVSRRFELTRPGFPDERLNDSCPYFVRSLFREVIFPDQHLIAQQMRTILTRARLWATAAGIAALTLSISAWSLSYINNYRLMSATQQELQLFDTPDRLDQLTKISFVQARIDQLSNYAANTPAQLRFGLYTGNELLKKLKQFYTDEASRQFLMPLKHALEQQLIQLSSAHFNPTTDAGAADITEFYQVLKTYLMLGDKQHADSGYLSQQLHRYWAPLVIDSHEAKQLEPYIEQIVAFYTGSIKESYVPRIALDDALITRARANLASAMHQLPASERTFNQIIETANSRYPATGVAELLGGVDTDLLRGTHVIPGAYTRTAWEGYVRDAIHNASQDSLQESDWVLATSAVATAVSATETESNRRYLTQRYESHFIDEWQHLLASASVAPFNSVRDAATKLERLSDFKQSPISRMLAAIAWQAAWNSEAGQPGNDAAEAPSIKSAIVERLLPAANTHRAGDVQPDGTAESQSRFNILTRLTNEQAPTSLIQYCAALAKVKLRLESITTASDAGRSARALIRSTNDSRSELADALLLIDSPLLVGADTALKSSLKRLLSQPLTFSYATTLPLASSDLNRRWQRQVYPEWQALAGKYPFSSAEADATIEEINTFLAEETGKLDDFIGSELQGLLAHDRDRLVPRRWHGQSMPFQREFLSQLQQTLTLRDTVLRTTAPSRFDLQPVPSPGISEMVLEIDGQPQRYRNGPQLWSTVSWPSEQSQQGAKITITTFSGRTATVHSIPGRFGWIRLAEKASRRSLNNATTQLTWSVPNPDSGSAPPVAIRFNLRPISGTSPLALIRLAEMSLPQKVTR